MEINTYGDGDRAPEFRPAARQKLRRGARRRRIEPYAWLTAGAVGIGIATALAAPAVAHADESSSSSASTAGPSASETSSTSKADLESPALGQRAGDDDDSKTTRSSADADSDSVRGDDRDTSERSQTTKRTHRNETSAAESGEDSDGSTRRTTRDLRTEAESQAPENIDTALAAPADVPAPATARTEPAPQKTSGPVTALSTATDDLSAAAVPATADTSATASKVQPKTLKSLLIELFARLNRKAATTTTTTAASTGTSAAVPTKEDAGLSEPFQRPDAPQGRIWNIRDYGATSNQSSDNDAVVIQGVINAAKAGDTVYIPNGTYHIKSTINLKSGVTLIGESRENTILAGAYTTQPHAMIYAAPGTTNLTLSSFTITSASGRTYKAAVRLGLEGGSQVSRIAVQNLFIEKFERFGVQLQNAYQVVVENNVIKNATALGGGGQGYGVIIDQALSNNNWIVGNEIGPVIRHAVLIQKSAHHNLIEQNTITGTVSSAIDLHGEDEYANEIRYNTISNGVRDGTSVSPNGAGIEVGEFSGIAGTSLLHDNSGPGNYIHHNTVYNYSMGLRVVNNSNYTFIENNVFHSNLGAGIQADLAPLNNLYISGNQLYNNGSGVILYDVTQVVVENNTIRDNREYGLWANARTNPYLIIGNTITGSRVNVTLKSPNGTYEPLAS